MKKSLRKCMAVVGAFVMSVVACPPEALMAAATTLTEYIPFEYEFISVENNGYALAEKNGVAGVLNLETKAFQPTGNWTMISRSPGIDTAFPQHVEGAAYYQGYTESGEHAIIQQNGQNVEVMGQLPSKFIPVEVFTHYDWDENGENRTCSVQDSTGKIIVEPGVYDEVGAFYNGVATAVKDGKMGLIDEDGKVIEELKHQMVVKSALGYIIYDDGVQTSYRTPDGKVEKVEDWRLITTGGYGYSYEAGLQVGTTTNYRNEEVPVYEYGLILANGEVETKYSSIEPLQSNPVRLEARKLDYTSVLMDESYNVLSTAYENITAKEKGTFVVEMLVDGNVGDIEEWERYSLPKTYGIIDEAGKEILPVTYEKPVRQVRDGLYTYISGATYGFLDQSGQQMTEAIYQTDISYFWGDKEFLPIGDSEYIPVSILNPNPTKMENEWETPPDKWIYGVLKVNKEK